MAKWSKERQAEYNKEYGKTKEWLLAKKYSAQRWASKKRWHPMPTYTKQELIDWCFSQKDFHILFDNRKRLDFQKMYTPSVDRKDDYIWYTIDNIQLMTWQDNITKSHNDRFNGINNKRNVAVAQYTIEWILIWEYYSASKAHRETEVSITNILRVCNWIRKTAGGYIWKHI